MEELIAGLAELLIEIVGEAISYAVSNRKKDTNNTNKNSFTFPKRSNNKLPKELIEKMPTSFSSKALYLMVLLYLYYENDGKFSKEEKRAVKKHLLAEELRVGEKHYKILKKITKKRPTTKSIAKFIELQNLHVITVESMLIQIKKTLKHSNTYLKELDALEIKLI